jgi:hypothetical protein
VGEQLATLDTQSDTRPTKRKPGQRGKDLTGFEVADILRWHAQGLTQQQIAAKFEPPKAQSTISETIQRFGSDRTEEAKAILRGGAPDMALNVVRNGKPKDQVAALKGLSVLTEDRSAGLVIQIGVKDSDVTVNLTSNSTSAATFASETSAVSADMHRLSASTGSDNS